MHPEQSGARLALVIGNGSYRSAPRLRNAMSDARAITEKLSLLGFRVRTEFDLDGEHFQRVVGEFSSELAQAAGPEKKAKAVLYFAGHGVQVRGENYLLPVDGDIASEVDLRLRTVHLSVVIEALNSSADTTIVMLDCCRENPLPRTLADGRTRGIATQGGLATFDAPTGTFVAFATQPDNVAEDGEGDNSPFTAALLEYIDRPDSPISEMLIHVRRTVHERTNGRQIPWDRSALFEPFAFKTTSDRLKFGQASAEEQEEAREEEYWNLIGKSDSPELLRSFVLQFPHGRYRQEALQRIEDLRRKQLMRGIWSKVAAFAFAVVAAAGIFYGQKWARFTTLNGVLDKADLVGGDLYFDAMHSKTTKNEPLWMCRFRCTMSLECVAFSYDTVDGVCYRKFEYVFYEDTVNKRFTNLSRSEVLRWSGLPRPQPLPFEMNWDRQIVGDLLPRERVEADPQFRGKFGELKRTKKQFWTVGGVACQRRCNELGESCRGFTYSTFYRHCQLFAHVRGLATDPVTGAELAFPATPSGCRSRGCRDPGPAIAPAVVQPLPLPPAQPSTPPLDKPPSTGG
jgi:hypothetical protein